MPTIKLLRRDDSCNNGKWSELFIGRTGISLFRERFTPPLPAEQCGRIVEVKVEHRRGIANACPEQIAAPTRSLEGYLRWD